jgi:hypothetical protein
MPHSNAFVRTDRPARYAEQLAKHFGHRVDTAWNEDRGYIALPDGSRCELVAEDGRLACSATAPNETALAQLEGVVKRHLERWGERDGIAVEFVRA